MTARSCLPIAPALLAGRGGGSDEGEQVDPQAIEKNVATILETCNKKAFDELDCKPEDAQRANEALTEGGGSADQTVPKEPSDEGAQTGATKELRNVLGGFSTVYEVKVNERGEASVTVESDREVEDICAATRIPDSIVAARVEDQDGVEMSNCEL